MSFVHLRVHTEYSLSDSIIKIDDLVSQVSKLRMPAVGITERQNIFSAVKVYKACRSLGVKPIIGAEVVLENTATLRSPSLLVLICQNIEGFQALCKLLTKAHQQVKHGGSISVKQSWLSESDCRGLIALSAGSQGELGHHLVQNERELAQQALRRYQTIFPHRFYLEISRFGEQAEELYNDAVLDFADETGTPLVATHLPRFIGREEYEFHEMKVAIHKMQTGSADDVRYTEEQYLCSAQEMAEKFADVPGALDNTVEIARRCNLEFDLNRTTHMPAYQPDTADFDIDACLKEASYEGLDRYLSGQQDERYRNRLEHELEIIKQTNFAGYFLIVSDIIRWAKSEGIAVGPGRGSGAGSLVAFCLDITTVDPIKHDLIFERFLTPDRISPPDFDIDFCIWDRDRVIDHVTEQYGKDQVAQIVTYQTMAARAAVKNVGRAIRPDYLFYDQLAKLIPEELNITLDLALKRSSDLRKRYENEARVKELIDSSRALEGLVLNVGKHPAGLVIAPTEITDFVALIADTESGRDTAHFDKDDLEDIGLVKFDFLGLRTLTIIALALRNINAKRNDAQRLTDESIPEDDRATFEYISSGRTAGIFQLESGGMQRLIHAIQPSEFNDLVALLALFRPGPLSNNMDKMYIDNQNRDDYDIPHPDLKEVLDPSHGVILYQEQVMKIAQIMSGYTLAEADILRKAMGKKLKKEMQVQRTRFVSGAVENGYTQKLAADVYDLIESFGGYGFNKSHSVAYAMLAYRTAYLKTHFRTEYLAAIMSVDMDIKTVVKICNDAKVQGIEVLPPDVNRSDHNFRALDDKRILYGLGALKRIGQAVVVSIEKARESGGEFKDLMDFCLRNDLQVVPKSACEALICGGAFDGLDGNRAALLNQLDHAYGIAQRRTEDEKHGQLSMFDEEPATEVEAQESNGVEWSNTQLLAKEFEILGLYLTGHPMDFYSKDFRTLGAIDKITSIDANDSSKIAVAGSVCNRHLVERRGEISAFFEIEDASGQLSIAMYAEQFAQHRDQFKENEIVVVVGRLESFKGNGQLRLQASRVLNIDTIRNSKQVKVILKLEHGKVSGTELREIKDLMTAQTGTRHKVSIEYKSSNGSTVSYSLNESWCVTVSNELIAKFREILGEEAVVIDYSAWRTRL